MIKTTIYQNTKGEPVLSVEGDSSSEAIVQAFLKAQQMLQAYKEAEKKEEKEEE